MTDLAAKQGEYIVWKDPVPRPDHWCEPPCTTSYGNVRDRRSLSVKIGTLASGSIWRCQCGRAWLAGDYRGHTDNPDPSDWTRYPMEDGPSQIPVKRRFRKVTWTPATQQRALTA